MDVSRNSEKAVLVLEDGTWYEGYHVGAREDAFGELVFNTSVVGYQQLLTDPANENNILVHTFPMLGNYGVVEDEDDVSGAHAQAVVMRDWCNTPSNYRSTGRFDEWLERKGITGIYGVDTRALTRKLRDHGTMKALVTLREVNDSNKAQFAEEIKAHANVTPSWKNASQVVTAGNGKTKLTVVDFGARRDIIDALVSRDCTVTVVPASSTKEQILATAPDGIIVSGGWVDFADAEQEKKIVEELTHTGIPMMGIGDGHLLMGLCAGGKITKMSVGHRGANCPVTELKTERTFITTQNHGSFIENIDSTKAEITHVNTNDKTCVGLHYLEFPGVSVQFLPEWEIGQKNFDGVYEGFLGMLKK